MTVKELLELNQQIVDVVIEVRENGSLLVDALHMGMDAGVEPPYPLIINQGRAGQHKALYIRKSINAFDDGREYWQVKPERIPAKWLGLDVFSWGFMHVYKPHHSRDDMTNSMQGIRIVALPSGQSLSFLVEKAKKQEEEQLAGQMNIGDFLGGTNEK